MRAVGPVRTAEEGPPVWTRSAWARASPGKPGGCSEDIFAEKQLKRVSPGLPTPPALCRGGRSPPPALPGSQPRNRAMIPITRVGYRWPFSVGRMGGCPPFRRKARGGAGGSRSRWQSCGEVQGSSRCLEPGILLHAWHILCLLLSFKPPNEKY